MNYQIRLLSPDDNSAIAAVIRQVSAEYGLTAERGFSVADPCLDNLFAVYQQPRSAYWVVEADGVIYGGAGISPLTGAGQAICELQKMYFLPQLRGQGVAKKLAEHCFSFARQQGFSHCYLETTACLSAAIKRYEKLGFNFIEHSLGSTGHGDCEIRMLKSL